MSLWSGLRKHRCVEPSGPILAGSVWTFGGGTGVADSVAGRDENHLGGKGAN